MGMMSLNRSRPGHTWRWLVAGTVVAAVCAACGSSGGGGSSGGSSGASSSAAIHIMGEGVFNSPDVSLPDAEAAMKAAVALINAGGGVHGHKLILDICDDQLNPNLAAGCARTAVTDHDVAVAGGFSAFTPDIVPILQAAGIPYFNADPGAPVDFTSPIEFPLTGGVQGQYASLGVQLAEAGCKKVGAVVDGDSVNEIASTWLQKGAQSKGASYVSVVVSPTAVDFASPVAQLESEGAKCIVPDTAPPAGPKIVTAVAQSGKKLQIGAVSAEFGNQTLQTLGSQANGIIIVAQERRPGDSDAAITTVTNAMVKYTGSGPVEPLAIDAWASVDATAAAIAGVKGTVTAAAVLKAAEAITTVNSDGLLAPYSFSQASPVPSLPRAKNWDYLTWKVENGKTVPSSSSWIALTGLS